MPAPTRPWTPLAALLSAALLAMALPLLWRSGAVRAEDPVDPPAASAERPAPPLPSVQERWGWSPGVVAGNTGPALSPIEPVQVAFPDAVASRVQGPTAILYFGPTCPHCRHAMPELNALAALQPDLAFLGVATGQTTPEALEEFRTTFQITFPLIIDADRGFARATGARSTPSLYLVQPAPAGTVATSGEATAPGSTVLTVTEAFLPYARGTAPVIAMRRNALGQRLGADGQPLPPDPFRDFRGYQGVRACATCHGDEATSWAITHHAGAYMTLYARDQAEDLACVGCHVAGMGSGGFGTLQARDPALGGFEVGDHSSPHTDVGCEACHGPSGPHDGDPAATAGGGDATASCAGCHDAKHSIAFTVEKAMPFIDHYAAVGMDDETLRARLDALADGTAARPMLALPEGPTVGAAACKQCHKAEHKAWARDPHARAMKTLGADAGRVECARCHATAAAYGGLSAEPTRLDQLRSDEGVGCEACHGPGGAHLADPRAETIVQLGEACPVCVLEGICTACHDPQQDPSWDLDTRLRALPYAD